MLQDLERGRPMEIDALVTSVHELGKRLSIPTPTIDTVLAPVRHAPVSPGCTEPD
jgi:2-dehydropantoate 2-reductase